jgi:ABC-type transport system involved in cytochrome c biogenesis permease subunit
MKHGELIELGSKEKRALITWLVFDLSTFRLLKGWQGQKPLL